MTAASRSSGPLIECAEADIAEHARLTSATPSCPCNLCGSQDGLRREAMAKLLCELERDSPNLRAVMLSALKNVSATHLLDPRLLGRAAEAGPVPGSGPRRLPVLS
jgi:tRNA 2-thiocytidine biosynthesis protein TtcA